jgi:sulfide:quinone oxidoreductase
MPSQDHEVVVVGGGSAGISVAARLRRAGLKDVAVIDPATMHYYQPLWTLVGGGCAEAETSGRLEERVMPKGVDWIKSAATGVDPDTQVVNLSDGAKVGYQFLVMAPGIQLDWHKIEGARDLVGTNGVSSNYEYELAPKTWDFIQDTRSGTAVFGMPSGPIKCAGAPQKIAYLACDYWRTAGVLDQIDVHLVLPTPGMFGVPVFARELEKVVKRYGITVHFESEIVEVDADSRKATVVGVARRAGESSTLPFDMMHLVPPQSAPDWVKQSSLADPDNPAGYVHVDKHTMQHPTYSNVFALGDAGSSPNSKTGAAIRKQAPVVAENLQAVMHGKSPQVMYDGYASCPLTTSRKSMLLAEFDYTMEPHPTIPLINTKKERRDMWYLKKYGLPALYWNLMLKGLA